MPGRLRETLLAAVITVALAGCGSDDEGGNIPQDNANTLIGQLDAVERAVASADCDVAQGHAEEFVRIVNELPADVGVETKEALREAGAHLGGLAAEQCAPTEAAGQTDTEATTETTEPTTTETTTTDTATTTAEEDGDEGEDEGDEEQPDEEQPQPEAPSNEGSADDDGDGPPSGGLAPGGGDR